MESVLLQITVYLASSFQGPPKLDWSVCLKPDSPIEVFEDSLIAVGQVVQIISGSLVSIGSQILTVSTVRNMNAGFHAVDP